MSLVNDMLNDLEQRRSERSEKPVDLSWLSGQPGAQKRRSYRWLYLALVIVLLAIIAWLYRPWQGVPVAPVATTAVKPVAIEAVTEQRLAKLTAVNWSDGQQLRMRLALDHLPSYSLQRNEQGLTLRLFGAETSLQSEWLQPLKPVSDLSIQKQESDVILTLRIDGEYRFSDRVLTTPAQQIEIVIESLAKQPQLAAAVPSQSVDKTRADSPQSAMPQKVMPQQAIPKQAASTPVKSSGTAKKSTANNTAPQLTLSQRDMQLVNSIKQQMLSGDYYHAEQQLEAFVNDNPRATRASKLLATLRIKQQRYDSARQLLEAVLLQNPDDIEARSLKARLLMGQGDNQGALQWLMSSKPSLAQHPEYYELLGLAARRNQQYLLSEQVYRGLVDSDQTRGDWWVGLGIALDAQVKNVAAREAFQRALDSHRTPAALRQYAEQRLAMQQ